MTRLFFLGLVFTTSFVFAQTNFRPGYVINSKGDTLKGTIDYRGDLLMGEVCCFKVNDKAEERIFYPDDITSFRFIDSKYFISKEVNGKKVFLEFLINGKINIYYRRDETGDHYYIEKEGEKFSDLSYVEEVRYRGNTPYLYQSKNHIGLLTYFMKDAPGLKSRIEDLKKPDHKGLVRLAEDYHNAVCKDESCIIYEKKVPVLKVDLEIIGGGVDFRYINDIIDNYYFQAGIITHFWMPRANEKLFFRTGFLRSEVQLKNGKSVIYRFPIQIEYIYPKGIIRPKLAVGVNLYKPFLQTSSFMGGVNIKLLKSLYLAIDYDIDFITIENVPLIPAKLFSQSLSCGLQIKL
jgi:hypothetical protein